MKSIVFAIAFFIPTLLYSQSSTKEGNTFPSGVYLHLKELQEQRPSIQISQLLFNGEQTTHVKKWFRGDSLFYMNESKIKRSLSYDSVYAFVDDGILYIQRKGYDHKVTVAGQLCYFVESYPIRRAASAPVSTERNTETIPHLLDLFEGELVEYSVASLETILILRDEELYQEFIAIKSPKKQRQMLIRFVERFNERNPLTKISQ
ncbi:MAG: hypothetical protein ACKVQV_10010 [Bacteroidia bacterium]